MGQEGTAGVGERDAAPDAVEHRQPQRILELADLVRQGGRGNALALGRAAQVLQLGGGDEVTQVAQFEGVQGGSRRAGDCSMASNDVVPRARLLDRAAGAKVWANHLGPPGDQS